MAKLQELRAEVLMRGRIEGQTVERLRNELYADGKIDRAEADFLVELHKRFERPTGPGWEKFFYQAIKDHVLADGVIDVKETAWLRQWLGHDGRIDANERKLLLQLRGEATHTCPQFEDLCKEVLK
jgi:hypothetical protein